MARQITIVKKIESIPRHKEMTTTEIALMLNTTVSFISIVNKKHKILSTENKLRRARSKKELEEFILEGEEKIEDKNKVYENLIELYKKKGNTSFNAKTKADNVFSLCGWRLENDSATTL